ncbi:MAG TPA: serine/threonine protein kinase [Anaerolineae bacterium]|nr:serine/threonine protein kinase [Anaerolineae bacterium]HQK14835.1 serine/threonine protein kinase [Anaerolineae bacterium]
MHILKEGQTVQTVTSRMPCTAEKFLGGGGQGEVYRADLGGQKVALKWYFPAQATRQQRAALEVLIKKGPPTAKFLWPMELTESPEVPGFGYIMPLRGPQYKSIVDLMKRQAEPTFRALATAGLELADSFLELHAMGLCYRDISFGNVFFEPNTGEALICDNDNVAVDGETEGGVLGTPRFMAPEIVRGEARPSMQTDLYSLAVLLFYMLMVHHPLEGKRESSIKCLDLPAMNKLYGTDPLFIYDPDDDSNRPVPGFHDNVIAFWPLYPQFIRDLFTKAFTKGLRDPLARVRESEWRAAMVRMRDAIIYCPKCGLENFYSAEKLKASGGNPGTCWSCNAALILPPRIRIEDAIVMLNWDTKLYPHHIDNSRLYDFSKPVAEVNQHPTDPTIWGLRNLTDEKWVITTADGEILDVEPGRNVRLAVGTKINFGKKEGEIRI